MLVARAEGDGAAAAEHAGGVDDLAGLEAPAQAPVADRVEARVGRAGVDGLVPVDDRRAEDALAGRERPGPVAGVVAGADRAATGVEAVVAHGGPGRAAFRRHIRRARRSRSGAAGRRDRENDGNEGEAAHAREANRRAPRPGPSAFRSASYAPLAATAPVRNGRILRPLRVADRGEPVEHSSPNGADARAAHAALAGRDRRGGPGAAGPPWRADPRDRAPLRGQPRGRRGRLPARRSRSCSPRRRPRARRSWSPWLKTVVKHEAFALRRQRDRLTPVTGDGEPIERGTAPGRHARAGRALRAAEPERRGAEPAQAAGDPLPGAAGAGPVLPGDLRDDRVHLHEGQPLPDRGPAGAVGRGWRASRAGSSASGWRRSCRRWPTARPMPRRWPCCART